MRIGNIIYQQDISQVILNPAKSNITASGQVITGLYNDVYNVQGERVSYTFEHIAFTPHKILISYAEQYGERPAAVASTQHPCPAGYVAGKNGHIRSMLPGIEA